MKNTKICLLLSSFALVALTACGPNQPATSDGSTTATTSSTGTNGGSSFGSVEAEKYLIVLHNSTGITLAANPIKAEAGATVTITWTASSGYKLTALTANGVALDISSGTSATFTMPDQDVDVRSVSALANVESGDITLGGVASAKFEKQGNVYVAKNVVVNDGGFVYVAINGDSSYTPLGWSHFNKKKSFGVISFAYRSDGTDKMKNYGLPGNPDLSVNGNESLISVGGNATYDFYFDPSNVDKPISIQRVKVNTLPTTVKQMTDVFVDSGYSDPAMYPANVTGVTYTNSLLSGETYQWKRYQNASLATIQNALTEKTYYVYHAYDKDNALVTTVDNYLENKTYHSPYPYSGGTSTEYIDTTKMSDSAAYSANYKVQAGTVADDDEEKSIKVSANDAEAMVNSYSHDVQSLDFAIHEGYRTGFTIEDDLTAANVDIQSTANEDGTFSMVVNSYKTWTPTSGSGANTTMSKNVHTEYKMEMTFTAGGAPLTGKYIETMYDETSYNFTTNAVIAGQEGTLVKKVTWAYTYGEDTSSAASFDPTPYFATSVSAVVKGKNGDNTILGGWRSTLDDEPLEITVSPSTALNAAQFAIVASSNTAVIAPSKTYGGFQATATPGTTTLTIANLVTGTPSTTIDVTLAATRHKMLYIYDQQDSHITSSTSFTMHSNETWTTRLYNSGEQSNGGSQGCFDGMTVESSNADVLTATVDAVSRKITFVSKKVESNTTVTLTIHSNYYVEGYPETTFTATVIPDEAATWGLSDLYGDWQYETDPNNTTLTLSSTEGTPSYDTQYTWYQGTLALDEDFTPDDSSSSASSGSSYGHVIGTVTFLWRYDSSSGFHTMKATAKWTSGSLSSWDFTNINLVAEGSKASDLKVGVALWGEINNWSTGGGDGTIDYEVVLGQVVLDQDYEQASASQWVFFDKKSA